MGRKFKIRPIGNSYGIIIPKPILEEHDLKDGQYLELSLKDKSLIFAKVDGNYDKNKANRGRAKAGKR